MKNHCSNVVVDKVHNSHQFKVSKNLEKLGSPFKIELMEDQLYVADGWSVALK